MARNIEPTPTLYGKDADRFAKRLKERPTAEKKKFLHKAYTIYKTIQSNPYTYTYTKKIPKKGIKKK